MAGAVEYASGARVDRGHAARRITGSPIAGLRLAVGNRFGPQYHLNDEAFLKLFERGVQVEEARKRTSARLREQWRRQDHLERMRRGWS